MTNEQEQAIRRDERVKVLRELANDIGLGVRDLLLAQADRLEAEGRKEAEPKAVCARCGGLGRGVWAYDSGPVPCPDCAPKEEPKPAADRLWIVKDFMRANGPLETGVMATVEAPRRPHLINGEFQSDKTMTIKLTDAEFDAFEDATLAEVQEAKRSGNASRLAAAKAKLVEWDAACNLPQGTATQREDRYAAIAKAAGK